MIEKQVQYNFGDLHIVQRKLTKYNKIIHIVTDPCRLEKGGTEEDLSDYIHSG